MLKEHARVTSDCALVTILVCDPLPLSLPPSLYSEVLFGPVTTHSLLTLPITRVSQCPGLWLKTSMAKETKEHPLCAVLLLAVPPSSPLDLDSLLSNSVFILAACLSHVVASERLQWLVPGFLLGRPISSLTRLHSLFLHRWDSFSPSPPGLKQNRFISSCPPSPAILKGRVG